MKSISAYISGFKTAFGSFRLILFLFLVTLAAALLLALPFYGLFARMAGNSLLPQLLMKGPDATVIRELLAGGGKLFGFYLQAFWPWMVTFLLLQVFLNGGIYSWISNPRGKFTLSRFFAHGRKYFWRFLKLVVYFIVIQMVIALVIWLPYIIATAAREGLTDDRIVKPLIAVAAIHAAVLVFLLMASDLAKSAIYETDTNKVLKSVWISIKTGFARFRSCYPLGIFMAVTVLAAVGAYYIVRVSADVSTTGMIFLFFLIQQVFILFRALIRVWRLSAFYHHYLRIRG